MLCLDSPVPQPVGREILEVAGHDDIGRPADCAREHVPVVGIREIEETDQILEVGDQCVTGMSIHEITCAFQSAPCQIPARSQNGVHPFLMDGI